jgi:OmpA-OmpF porin, OOP family
MSTFTARLSISCLVLAALWPAAAFGQAGATSGPAQHPLVPHYDGAELLRREAEAFSDYALRTGKARPAGVRTVEGQLTRLTYQAPRDRAVLEVFRNYETGLRQAGYEILFSCARADCGDIRRDIASGPRYMLLWAGDEHRYLAARRAGAEGEVSVALFVARNESGGPARGRAMIQLDVVESRPMEDRMAVVEADALGAELARSGRATLHGIEFDSDRDTLRPESRAQIAEIARLLAADPALSVRVVGHTDAQGTAAHNLDLSRRRAQRVVDALATAHGVARARMQAEGLGASRPLADNGSEDGRARNRRVEIIRR